MSFLGARNKTLTKISTVRDTSIKGVFFLRPEQSQKRSQARTVGVFLPNRRYFIPAVLIYLIFIILFFITLAVFGEFDDIFRELITILVILNIQN